MVNASALPSLPGDQSWFGSSHERVHHPPENGTHVLIRIQKFGKAYHSVKKRSFTTFGL